MAEVRCVCGNTNLLKSSGGLFCNRCWNTVATPAHLAALSAPVYQEAERLSAPTSEAELVEQIRTELTRRGWRVWRIGQDIVKGSGSDPGVPDLLCVRPGEPPFAPLVRLLEVKFGSNGPTPEQQALISLGAAQAVWSVSEALVAVGERIAP